MDKLDYKTMIKHFFGYAIGGLLFFLIAGGIAGAYAGFVGFESGNEIAQFTAQFVGLQPLGMLYGLGLFLILGALVMVFGYITLKIRELFGDKNKVKFRIVKKRYLLPLLGVGAITFVILSGIGQIATGINPAVNLTDPVTLLDALIDLQFGSVVGSLILFAITGWAVVFVSKKEPVIEDVADKTHLSKI